LVIFFEKLHSGEAAGKSEIPLVAVLRDTLGDSGRANDRLRKVWVVWPSVFSEIRESGYKANVRRSRPPGSWQVAIDLASCQCRLPSAFHNCFKLNATESLSVVPEMFFQQYMLKMRAIERTENIMSESQFAASESTRLRRAFQMRWLQKSVRAGILLGTLFSPQDGSVILLGHAYSASSTWDGTVVTAGRHVFPSLEKSNYGEVQR
jgi:hypothetical protein